LYMAKSIYVCQSCAAEFKKWAGQCSECQAWNSISEEVQDPSIARLGKAVPLTTTPITQTQNQDSKRRSTGIDEFDRVLGGGLVHGSAILLGGSPGIGKSTLLLQAAAALAASPTHRTVLYITGEESIAQVAARGERIQSQHDDLHVLASCELESIVATIAKMRPSVVVVDSVQTTVSAKLSSAPGTVSQVRDCAAALIQQAKKMGHVLVLVGHVTKDGALAGPRVLEHMVDAVLYFEGERGHAHRIVRAVKNRFGPAGEIGVFEMSDRGLKGIGDASRLFLAERSEGVAGSVVLACMEGTRPLLVEVQALVAKTVYATPKRSAVGLDANRVAMLIAVLERRANVPLASHDVYINVAGGVKIMEPGADVAIALAVLSAFQDQPLTARTVVFGELGLTGEVRAVGHPEARVREAVNLGFNRLLLPSNNAERVQDDHFAATLRTVGVVHVAPITTLADMAQQAFASTIL
ncbi:MAG: DNA repair protein RadA, partial [Mariprofundaceae bacterium]|nr:DNA repair protein RadA [Mariprofundaceae bacterium]